MRAKTLVALILLAQSLAAYTGRTEARAPGKPLAGYDTIVIEEFKLADTRKMKDFPRGSETLLQHNVAAQLRERKIFAQVIDRSTVNPEQLLSGDKKRLVLSSTIVEFHKFTRTRAIFMDRGGGASTIKVSFTIRDAASGEEIWQKEIEGYSDPGVTDEASARSTAMDRLVDFLIADVKKKR